MNRLRKRALERARMDMAVAMVAGALDVTVEEVMGDARAARAVLARQVAMYVAAVGFGMSYGRVAAAIGRDRSTVAHACKLVEDRREDAQFDRWIDALEMTAAAAPILA
jgi:chromosomal replication initiation ATPase DnaA